MTDWIVRMDVYAHSTGNGSENDRKAVGGNHQTFNVKGEEFRDAVAAAELLITGIKTNPMVWQCHITAIEKTRR